MLYQVHYRAVDRLTCAYRWAFLRAGLTYRQAQALASRTVGDCRIVREDSRNAL